MNKVEPTEMRIVLRKVDGPEFPKQKTKKFLVDGDDLSNIKTTLGSSICFGKLDPGSKGQHTIGLRDMHYGIPTDIPFITRYRTARDDEGEPLSRAYFFDKGDIPISVFFLVKKPWTNLIGMNRGRYVVQAYVRSPEKTVLQESKTNLERMFER